MSITIKVRLNGGSYHARAMGLGTTASCSEGPSAAARAVCRKLGVDPTLLEQHPGEPQVSNFSHPGSPGEDAQS
jgi:hypothetical protein